MGGGGTKPHAEKRTEGKGVKKKRETTNTEKELKTAEGGRKIGEKKNEREYALKKGVLGKERKEEV